MTKNLETIVHEALDNARDNGYDLGTMTDMEVAIDLIQYNSECEEMDALELAKHVKSWKGKRNAS